MAGTTLAGEQLIGREIPAPQSLPPVFNSSRNRLRFEIATPAADPALRQLLRDCPMQGSIQLTLEREPHFFAAAAIEGKPHQTLIARDASTNQIIALGSRSFRQAYINGRLTRLGYLSQLRVHPHYRGRDLILGSYDFLHRVHASDAQNQTPFYLTSILTENRPARRLLEANLKGMPTYHPLEQFLTFILPTPQAVPKRVRSRHKTNSSTGTTTPAAPDPLAPDVIVNFLNRYSQQYQFAPYLSHAFDHAANLTRDDFIVLTDNTRITACAAVWDQRGFKQTIVRAYTGSLARWRWLTNALSPLTGWPRLPRVNQPLRQAYLSHLAIQNNDPPTFSQLLDLAVAKARAKRCDYLIVGLAARHPLVPVLRARKHRLIQSTLYAVHWPKGRAAVESLDTRIPHVEVATL